MSTASSSFAHAGPPQVIVASGNAVFRKHMIEFLAGERRSAIEAIGGADALLKLETGECTSLMLDRNLPDLDVDELAGMVSSQYPKVAIEICDSARPPSAECEAEPEPPVVAPPAEMLPGLVGESSHLDDLSRLVRLVAPRRTTVLLLGETGTGKERVAHAIHQLSGRANRPWVVVNCAAIPEALLESELFGYLRGAFTGAVQTRAGRILSAHTGTLFLDEIGELPLMLQAKLLRFLQEGELQRLGSNDAQRVDVRVVAATNQDLAAAVDAGRFRRDLYYRLAVFPIELQPLRLRPADVLPLAEHFLRQLHAEAGAGSEAAPRLTRETAALLEQYAWPGNVRELQHTVERALILAARARELGPEHFPALTPAQPPRIGPRRAE